MGGDEFFVQIYFEIYFFGRDRALFGGAHSFSSVAKLRTQG
jgi:hypothetical protein